MAHTCIYRVTQHVAPYVSLTVDTKTTDVFQFMLLKETFVINSTTLRTCCVTLYPFQFRKKRLITNYATMISVAVERPTRNPEARPQRGAHVGGGCRRQQRQQQLRRQPRRLGQRLRLLQGTPGQCCQRAKFDPFLSLNCARVGGRGGAIQGKEGIKFCSAA